MVNETVRLGLKMGISSRKRFPRSHYHHLRRKYRLQSSLVGSAIGMAAGLLKARLTNIRKGRRAGSPYCRKPFLVASERIHIREDPSSHQRFLDLPELIRIPMTDHILKAIDRFEIVSATLTETHCCVSYSNGATVDSPVGLVGIDTNLRNITMVDDVGNARRFDISALVDMKETYRDVRSHFTRVKDRRLAKEIFGKYGEKQHNATQTRLHQITAEIVRLARENHWAIAIEQLDGLRERYRRDAGWGRDYRAKMNSWAYYEFMRQVKYKAAWNGVEIVLIPPANTSRQCSRCNLDYTIEMGNRTIECYYCGLVMDRDENAARNILAKGRALRFGAVGHSGEAMTGESPAPPEQMSVSPTRSEDVYQKPTSWTAEKSAAGWAEPSKVLPNGPTGKI